MKKSFRVLSAAFASAMLLLGAGQAVAGDGDGGYGGRGGYGYRGGYGHSGGYGYRGGYGHRGGYGGRFGGGYFDDGGWGGYSGGYGGNGGYGGGYGGGYSGGFDDYRIDDVDICFDGDELHCRFEMIGECGEDQLEIYAFLTGDATCGGGGGWYDQDEYFSDVGIDGYYARQLSGNIWEAKIGLDDYAGEFCDGSDYGGDLDFRRVRLNIGGRDFAFDEIGDCGADWYHD